MLLRPLRVVLDEDSQRGEAKQEGLDEPQEAGATIRDAFLAVGAGTEPLLKYVFIFISELHLSPSTLIN